MKSKTFFYLSGLFIALQLQAKSLFVYEPDWEKLATTIASDDSLSSIVKDPAVRNSISKINYLLSITDHLNAINSISEQMIPIAPFLFVRKKGTTFSMPS